MPVLTQIKVELSADELLSAISKSSVTPSGLIEAAQNAVAAANDLCQAAAIYAWLPVMACNDSRLILERGVQQERVMLHVGPHVELLKDARMVLIGLYTLGAGIEENSRQRYKSNQPLQAYLLDTAGVALLEKTAGVLYGLVEKEAARRNWGVSTVLSPGALQGWSLSGQAEIETILNFEQINVRLNASGMLVPVKSVSSLVGIGPGYAAKTVGTACNCCSRADNCTYRNHPNNSIKHRCAGHSGG